MDSQVPLKMQEPNQGSEKKRRSGEKTYIRASLAKDACFFLDK
jgi:hypothetical protein